MSRNNNLPAQRILSKIIDTLIRIDKRFDPRPYDVTEYWDKRIAFVNKYWEKYE